MTQNTVPLPEPALSLPNGKYVLRGTPPYMPFYTAHQMHAHAAAVTIDLRTALAERDELLAFIERWANHHSPKPHMTAEQALSVIQHHPAIKSITKQYSDGKVPDTFDPYAEITTLRTAAQQALEALESGDGWRQSDAITALTAALESKT